jgi:hypothetical protein
MEYHVCQTPRSPPETVWRVTVRMTSRKKHQLLTHLIATVWLVNGLFCKVLNLVPRHREIVSRILGPEHAGLFTVLIGISEIIMAAWILSRAWSKINAITQVIVIAAMNTLEFLLVPDLLLLGKSKRRLCAPVYCGNFI